MPRPIREIDYRKPPLKSRWTRNRRLLEAPAAEPPPPPEPDYVVTGDITPDATGDYVEDGTHDAQPKYKRSDAAFYIWWYLAAASWHISDTPGDDSTSWASGDTSIEGDYPYNSGTTGTATVSLA